MCRTCQLLCPVTWCKSTLMITYLVIPASNVQSREIELNRVAEWAQTNNLKLNLWFSEAENINNRFQIHRCYLISSVSRRYFNQTPICHWAHLWRHWQVCLNSVFSQSSPFSQLEWCSIERHMQIDCAGQAALCLASVVGIYHSFWQTPQWGFYSSCFSITVI